jgi:hypothetical protein
VFAVFDEQHAVIGVFVLLLCSQLCDPLCYRCCYVVPVFDLYGGVVDTVDVAAVVLASCTERASHRSAEQHAEFSGEFAFCTVSFPFVAVRHSTSLAPGDVM